MGAPSFISSKIRLGSKAASVSIAFSFVVIILSLAIAGGFKHLIYSELSKLAGDISVTTDSYFADERIIENASLYADAISGMEGVESVRKSLICPGLLKKGDGMHGVVFKAEAPDQAMGMTLADDQALIIPDALTSILGVGKGDRMIGYFIDKRVALRNFTVSDVYNAVVTDDDKLVVYCGSAVLSRILGCGEDAASALEVVVDKRHKGRNESAALAYDITDALVGITPDEQAPLLATSLRSSYPRLFDWLDLLDFNVLFLLLLMIVVCGVNMIAALLILLFQNIRTIGMLKAMGMSSAQISLTFLLSSARALGLAMLAGNAIAFVLCMIQHHTRLISLDPENYFISYVPVDVNWLMLAGAELLSFCAILALLMLPCVFIFRLDASKSVVRS